MLSQPLFWFTWLAVAVFMELWAMVLHGLLWHGPWWGSHRSHHSPQDGWLERNDLFSVIHALIAMGLIIYGCEATPSVSALLCVATGFGMTTFGVAYFVVHDGLIHGRLPVHFLSRFSYLRRVRNAHRVHHMREHLPPFGLFLGPQELKWRARHARRGRP